MDKHDRDKAALVERYVKLDPDSEVLDVECGAGTFLAKVRGRFGSRVTGVGLQGPLRAARARGRGFPARPLLRAVLSGDRFDLITMWHFLEHDYEPLQTLQTARDLLAPEAGS
jgi:2-polyprenyl-3-methyl-5-hydroxy-6-metoxy-1,4-benzoquinol methylase